jgi:hypothetical protein
MKIDLPEEYNTKEIKKLLKEQYPDVEAKIEPLTYKIKGSGDKVETDGGFIRLDFKNLSKDEKARIETELKQAIFDLPLVQTDAEEKKEARLKELLSGPAFVYILNEIDDLKKEIKKLKKKTTEQEPENNETIEIQPSEDVEIISSGDAEPKRKRD